MEKVNKKLATGIAMTTTGIALIVFGIIGQALSALSGLASLLGAVSDGPNPFFQKLPLLENLSNLPYYFFYPVILAGIVLLVLGVIKRDRAKVIGEMMSKDKKEVWLFVAFILLIVICLAEIVFYGMHSSNFTNLATSPAVTNNQSTTTSQYRNYPLPACGISLTVKTNDTVSTTTGNDWAQLLVGGSLPGSVLEISCQTRGSFPDGISALLSVQSDGSSQVNKYDYSVFDQATLSSISELYSAKNRGYRQGSETIGFQSLYWLYTFSFLNPAQERNQNSFVISVQ